MVHDRVSNAFLFGAQSSQIRQRVWQSNRLLLHTALSNGDHWDVGEILHLAYYSSRACFPHIQACASLQRPANTRAYTSRLAQRAHVAYVFSWYRCRAILVEYLLFRIRRGKVGLSLDPRRILVRHYCKSNILCFIICKFHLKLVLICFIHWVDNFITCRSLFYKVFDEVYHITNFAIVFVCIIRNKFLRENFLN